MIDWFALITWPQLIAAIAILVAVACVTLYH
jgi:hypothetical protein